jgi:hypothetical protein
MNPCSISTSAPIVAGGSGVGDTGNCDDDIDVDVTGTSLGGHCMTLIINDVIIQEISFSADGTYTFTNPGILETDLVVILVRDGNCLSTREGVVSATSSPTDACPIPMTIPCWITGNANIVTGLTVYTDIGMTLEFLGDGDFYHIQLNTYPDTYNVQINNVGVINAIFGGVCP